MALTKFVSAEWIHDEVADTYSLKAIGDDGETYWIGGGLDSDVPPWPDFIKDGGQVTGQGPVEEGA